MASTSTGFIGRSVKPDKSSRFITGNGMYVSDIRLPNMLHAALLPSMHAHARIRAVDVKEALRLDGVVGVWTGREIEGRISAFPESFEIHPARWLEGVKPVLQGPRPTALAQGKVHYVGEPVAIVVAADRPKAEDAVDAIVVEYEELPIIVDAEESLQARATLVHEGSNNNVVFSFSIEKGNVDGALSAAPYTLRERFRHHRYCAAPLEGRGVVAWVEPKTNILTVWSSTQMPHLVRRQIAAQLSLPEEAVFVMECCIDSIAARLRLDPAEVRRRNFVQPDEMPYHAGILYRDGEPIRYDSGNYPETLTRALEAAGYDELRRQQQELRQRGRYLGVGIGCYVEGTGVGSFEGARVRIDASGQLIIATGATGHGQGHETVFAQIAADLWGVTPDKVSLVEGDTASIPFGCGTFGSRSTVNVGSAIYGASARLKEKVVRLAAHILEANPDDLELGDGKVFIRGLPQRALSFSELARAAVPGWASKLPEGLEPGLEATFYFVPPTVTWANAAHVAVIEVEIDTGIIKLLDYVVSHDAGKLINPLLVDGQIHGGVAQGIGAALYEEIAYDQNGQLLSGSFVNYLLPGAMEVPNIKTVHLESPSPLNPLGVKGLGEGGAIAPPAAIANALADALLPFTVRVNEIPLSPNRVMELVAGAH